MYVIYSERKSKQAGEKLYWDGRKFKWVTINDAQQYASKNGLATPLDGVWIQIDTEAGES